MDRYLNTLCGTAIALWIEAMGRGVIDSRPSLPVRHPRNAMSIDDTAQELAALAAMINVHDSVLGEGGAGASSRGRAAPECPKWRGASRSSVQGSPYSGSSGHGCGH